MQPIRLFVNQSEFENAILAMIKRGPAFELATEFETLAMFDSVADTLRSEMEDALADN